MSDDLRLVICARSSFSTLRKKHTGPRQAKASRGLRVINASVDNARRAEARPDEGQRGQPSSAHGRLFNVYPSLSPAAKSPQGTRDAQTPSGLPPSPHSSTCPESSSPHGPRGGVPSLDFPFVSWCAAPLYGVAARPAIPVPLRLCVRADKTDKGKRENSNTQKDLPHQLESTVLPSRSGRRTASKGKTRRLCRGFLPLQAEIQRNPLQRVIM